MHKLRLQLGLLASAANTSSGETLNILGEFNLIQIQGQGQGQVILPAALVVRLVADPPEVGQHSLGIRLRNEDGQLLWTSPDLPITIQEPQYPGIPNRMQAVIQLHIVVPGPGSYFYEVVVDGRHLDDVELHVVALPSEASS